MKLHRLKQVSYLTIQNWLEKELELNDYQVSKMRRTEFLRFSKYKFFEPRQEYNTSLLYRLSIIPLFIVWLILFIGLPLNFIFTGKWGYNNKIYNFISEWLTRVGI